MSGGRPDVSQNVVWAGDYSAVWNDESDCVRFPSEVHRCDVAEVVAVELVGEWCVALDAGFSYLVVDVDAAPCPHSVGIGQAGGHEPGEIECAE